MRTLLLVSLAALVSGGCSLVFSFGDGADGGEGEGEGEGEPCTPLPVDVDAEPVLPRSMVRPEAGVPYFEPTFGTRMVRVTSDGISAVASSHRPVFNLDSKRLIVNDPTRWSARFFTFDPASLSVGSSVAAPEGCNWLLASWSHQDPDLSYVPCPAREGAFDNGVYTYRVSTGELVEAFDLDPEGLAEEGRYILSLSVDDSGQVFAGLIGTRIVVLSHGVASSIDRPGLGPPYVDRTGTYLQFDSEQSESLVELATGQELSIAHTEDLRGGCYVAVGAAVIVGSDCWGSGLYVRQLEPFSSVNQPSQLHRILSLETPFGDTASDVVAIPTLLQDDPRFVVAVTQGSNDDGVWSGFEQEVFAVATDGSWTLHLAHHRSVIGEDALGDEPSASVSFDGRLVAFSTNFDGEGRDVYVAALPRFCP